jgi:hypothetical protein
LIEDFVLIGYAGRRIDRQGQFPPRFPLANVGRIREEVSKILVAGCSVIGSVACGADLIVLDRLQYIKRILIRKISAAEVNRDRDEAVLIFNACEIH